MPCCGTIGHSRLVLMLVLIPLQLSHDTEGTVENATLVVGAKNTLEMVVVMQLPQLLLDND